MKPLFTALDRQEPMDDTAECTTRTRTAPAQACNLYKKASGAGFHRSPKISTSRVVQLGSRPYTSSSPFTVAVAPPLLFPRVPTYTLPFATVGTVNFTAFPAAFPVPCVLFHSSVARLVASYAWRTAGPQPDACCVQYWLLFSTHTMPLAVPCAETEGVAPGNPNVPADCDVCEILNWPVDVLNANDFKWPPAPAMYSALLKNAAVEKMPFPEENFCTTFESAGLKFAP